MTTIERKDNSHKTDAVFHRVKSMASYDPKLPKDNTPTGRKFRPIKRKVGRDFFEHDTRNNSDNLSYVSSIRSDRKSAVYIDQCITRSQCEETNVSKSLIEQNEERKFNESEEPSLDSNSTKSQLDVDSNVMPVMPYRSFVSKGHYNAFNYQGKFNGHQSNNNNKLKKKLFKIQRQLRLQTVALRRQRIAGNWCCSCACSSSKHGQMQNQFKHFDHQYNNGNGSECKFVVCNNNRMIKNGELRHPIHLQGLRSVVR